MGSEKKQRPTLETEPCESQRTWADEIDTTNRIDLKRELISEQVAWEINELNSPTALRRFGAPFSSPLGEVSPLDSELPILRYIFVHHVREFPFLDKAKEKEFWQDKLQVVGRTFLRLYNKVLANHLSRCASFSSRLRVKTFRLPKTDWRRRNVANSL